MKLNNRGWGLQAMLAAVLVLMIALVIVAVLVNKTFGELTGNLPATENNKENINNGKENINNNKDNVNNNSYKSYDEIENDIIIAAKKYQKEYYSDILDGEKISVTLKNLQEEKLISKIVDIKDNNLICSGYAIFINDDNNIMYSAYIKCGDNYETIGYQEFYDTQF